MITEDVGECVEEATGGHQSVLGGDGDVEEGSGGVLLSLVGGGVEGLGEIRNGSGVGDERPAFGVVLGDEPKLTEGLGPCLLGDGAQLRHQGLRCPTLHLHNQTLTPTLLLLLLLLPFLSRSERLPVQLSGHLAIDNLEREETVKS